MGETPNEQNASGAQPAQSRKLSPAVVGVVFLVLVMAWYGFSMLMSTSGVEVKWVNDLEEAKTLAHQRGQRVFLYLHAPECSSEQYYDRGLFQKRGVRARLDQMVPCRLTVTAGDEVAKEYAFDGEPLMLLLERGDDGRWRKVGQPQKGRHIQEQQFLTYFYPSAEH